VTEGDRPSWGERLQRLIRHPTSNQDSTEQPTERRQMTVMFVDLVGSTAMAASHEPEVVRDVVRRYQEVCARAIGRHGGHIASYAGDGVMAYFGFPAAHEDDVRQATLAGLDIVAALEELSSATGAEHGIPVQARVGIHTGLVLVTEMGSTDRPERNAVVGATPNEAARIQSVAPPGAVAISDVTNDIVRGYFEVESLGRPEMKGVPGDVEVFRVRRATLASDRLQAAGRALTPLVGRRDELGAVREHWAALGRSSCTSRIVLLRGEAGIGKSRVTARIVRDALADRHPLFLGMCSAERATSPLYPVVRLLESHFGFDPGDSQDAKLDRLEQGCDAAELSRDAVPVLAALLELEAGERYDPLELDPLAVRARTFDAITDLVLAMADRQRTLLVIEDLQWSDQSTLELIGRLGEEAPARGLLILVTGRPEFERPWGGPCCFTIALGPLPPDDHRDLIRELAGIHAVSEDLWDVIARRSDGNPLFTEELARAVHHAPKGRGSIDSIDSIPTTIRDLLTARLDALGRRKHLAQLASTLGRDVDADLLRTVSGLPRRQVTADLGVLVRAGILEELARPEGAVTHRFVHALVRDAAYDSQERLHDRRAAHLRVARALVERPGSDAGLIAQHFDAAHSLEDAAGYYIRAAMAAQQAAAHVEAIRLLDRAVEVVLELPEEGARDGLEINIRILRGLSTVNTQGYASPGAAEDYRRGLELSGRGGGDPALFTATVGIWAYYAVHGDLRAGAEAVARMEAMSHAEVEAEVLSCTGVQRFFEGRFGESRTAFDAAIAAFERRPVDQLVSPRWQLPSDPYAAALVHLGPLLWLEGDAERGREMVDAGCRRAGTLPFPSGPFSQGYAMTYAGWLANLEGRFAEGLDYQQQTLAISERYGLAFWNATATCHGAISRARLGDAAAIDTLAAGVALWRGLGAEAFVSCLQTELAALRLDARMIDEALHDVDQAIEWAEAREELFFVAESHRVRAAALRLRGAAPVEVRRALETSRRIAAEQGAAMFELRALMDLVRLGGADRREAAIGDLHRVLAALPEVRRPAPDVGRARTLLAELDG